MNINREYRRCKRAWRRLTRSYFSITDDKGRITYEYFGRGKNVQTWCDYTDFADFYICHYRDSEGVAFYELYSNAREKIAVDKSISGLVDEVKNKNLVLSGYYHTLQGFLASNGTANDDYIFLTITDSTKVRACRA